MKAMCLHAKSIPEVGRFLCNEGAGKVNCMGYTSTIEGFGGARWISLGRHECTLLVRRWSFARVTCLTICNLGFTPP